MFLKLNQCTLWGHNIPFRMRLKNVLPPVHKETREIISCAKLLETEEGATLYSAEGITLKQDIKEITPGILWDVEDDADVYAVLPKCKHFCAVPDEGYKVIKLDIFSKKPEGVEAAELLGYFVTVETVELT